MGVRAKQYAKDLEKNIKGGKNLMAAHKRAASASSTLRKKDKFDKPSRTDKIILAILRATGSGVIPKAKPKSTPKVNPKKKPTAPLKTTRHKDISSQLRKAGIDQATIDRMRGKKK